jgi:predicted nucleic acid-binding protein
MIVVADTSPLLHLGRIGKLDLVPVVVGRVIIPSTVWAELVHPGTRADFVAAIRSAPWIDVVDDPFLQDLGLDPGETAAILLAEQLRADALLIDERRGRTVATARGLSVIGTLGVVAGARRSGAVDRAAPIVAELRADGFWLSDELVAEFLMTLGEAP